MSSRTISCLMSGTIRRPERMVRHHPSAYGIRVASGTGHHIYHNSVHLFGVLPGIVGTDLTTAFMITTASATGMDVRNNIFSNQLTGGNPTAASTRHTAVYLPSGGASTMNLTWNNNSYYQGPATTGPLSLLAQVGPTAGNGQYFAADFDPGSVGNPLNLRTYSSTLSAASTNDNASFALAQTPPFCLRYRPAYSFWDHHTAIPWRSRRRRAVRYQQ